MIFHKQNNNSFRERVNSFFRGQKWKNVLTFFIFLVLAFSFWLLQYSQQKFEISLVVPVEYEHQPKGIVLDTITPRSVQVRIQDKGTSLLSYSFQQREPIVISLANINRKGTSFTLPEAELRRKMDRYLLTSTDVIGYSPKQLVVSYHPLMEKKVPVVLNGHINPAIGYMLFDTIQFNPAVVSVYGTAEVLAGVTRVITEKIQWENLDESQKKKIKLIPPLHTSINGTSSELSVAVAEYTEKTLELPVVCNNIPSDFTVRFFPSTVEMTFQVALSQYAEIQASSFEVCVDFQQLSQNRTYSFLTELCKKPYWLKNYRMIPEKIEFLIEKKPDL